MSKSEYIKISLTDPIKLSDKFGSYISYKITTSTNKSIYGGSEFSVTRRFSDFVWLSRGNFNHLKNLVILTIS